ncbi:hypothetical protein CBR_g39454 [Chara braunii]|uniref:Uncharacterized protein n=1 Tax=Chara braunii TaxID=69332 RepID=A0A388LRN1_CHABU|nr:hypothetical protein CBR_g39454 [Chara braunii]|eukprot:GBG84990.1 hypothetical protein CBR_g39454 [Chara braunii]
MGVPSGPGMSMPHMQSMIARPRFPLRPAPRTMPAGAGYVANASFSAQLAGGYAPPGVQSMPAGTAFGISGQVFPASQAMDGGYGCGAEPSWSPLCGQSSRRTLGQSTQPTFGGKSIPSPSSCRRTSSDQSASMIDVNSEDNGEVPANTTGWTPGGVGDGEGTWHDDTGRSSYAADEGDDEDDTSTQPGEMNDEDGGRRVEEGVEGCPGEDVNAAKGDQQKRRGGWPPTSNPKPKVPWTLDERIHLGEDDARGRRPHGGRQRPTPHDGDEGSIRMGARMDEGSRVHAQDSRGLPEEVDQHDDNGEAHPRQATEEEAPVVPFNGDLTRTPGVYNKYNGVVQNLLRVEWIHRSPTVGSEAKGTEESDSSSKARRTGTDKARVHEGGSGGSSLSKVMEDSTRSYCQGLDNVATALARATIGAGTAIAAKIGDVADAMRGGNSVLELLVGVLARHGGGGGGGNFSMRVNDVYAMDITAGLGYVDDGALSRVLLFVTKRHPLVPNRWEGPDRDAVGDTIKYLVFAIADEFANRMDDTPWYDTIFDPPLEGRGYLHGLVDIWGPEDVLRVRKW